MKLSLLVLIFIICSCSSHKAGRYIFLDQSSNLKTIAQKFNTDVKSIQAANPNTSLNKGNWIFIPYKGKTLFSNGRSLSSRYGNKIFSWPVPSSKSISSRYGKRRRRFHDGLDISAPIGSHIISAADGKVLFNGRLRGYGKVLIVSHQNNFHTVYAHLKKSYARKGQNVSEGEVIAQVGMTGKTSGPHLHFEVRFKNKILNPAHYLKWLPNQNLAQK